jgi:hypothetical protein
MAISVLISLLSGILMTVSIVYILTYILGSFSSKSGTISLRFALFSVFYFFGSIIFLYMGIEWLSSLAHPTPFYLIIGASALALNILLHVFCGFITAFLYLKGRMSRI